MKEETQISWLEAFKLTLIVMAWVLAPWIVIYTIYQLGTHWYQIKTFFGFGGQIL